ncbi:DUF885 domain-containing protein [Sphingomonas arenae]|uniref:DUF885 domain-containing protein n=1 Tax=Sphingomonas arenae TaxID=2812555 RepID=UPI001967213D|nr:DUF885 domain-containing protein [Sphingomonas arenae]
MKHILLLASTALLAACATTPPAASSATAPIAEAPVPSAAQPAPARNAELAAFFDEYDKAELALSPLSKSYRGIKDADYGKWDEFTDAAAEENRALDQRYAAELQRRFPRESLSPEDQLSYDLFLYRIARSDSLWPYRKNGLVFDQMNGAQSEGPAFLINIHKVDSVSDAEAYVSRISGVARYLDQAIAEAQDREARGVLAPKWVYPYVVADSRNLIKGAPFDGGADNDLWADFKTKVGKLNADQATKDRLLAAGRTAMVRDLKPAYQRVISAMQAQQAKAGRDDGIWRFPNGAPEYQARLRYYTTTDLTPDQIHQLGLDQVARIHREMTAIKDQVGFKGTLPEFFEHMRTSKQFYYPNTAAGKQMYLDESAKAQAAVQAALPRFFGRLPKTPLQIKPVEPFREKSAGKAFYNDPPPDGSRPGIYYVNLYDMNDMPSTEVEALFCHEGIPGHHLQGALLSELGEGEVPPFRQFSGYTATDEGWGLYAEKLCKEMGLYNDPYRDFGRLQLELHRAIRLVVDSGIHHKRWTREQAIKYVEDNSADAKGGIVKAIERYVVYPGQATAYMVGKLKIEELRAKAKAELGTRYDDRQFHDTVLLAGSMPLDLLEKRVNEWIAWTKAS